MSICSSPLFRNILALLAGATVLFPALAVAGPRSIWVMSYNIRYDNPLDIPDWRARRSPMVDQIRFFAPDILGLQEAQLHMVDDLMNALPGYSHFGVGRDDGVAMGDSTSVLFRTDRFDRLLAKTYWCSATPDVPGKAYDAALPRTFTRLVLRDRRNGALLDVRNLHLDHVGPLSRERCASQVRDLPPWKGAYLLAIGDFNSRVTDPPHQILTGPKAPYFDARSVSTVVFGPDATFNSFSLKPIPGATAIDFILTDRRMVVERFATLNQTAGGRVISDHFPILAEINFPQRVVERCSMRGRRAKSVRSSSEATGQPKPGRWC